MLLLGGRFVTDVLCHSVHHSVIVHEDILMLASFDYAAFENSALSQCSVDRATASVDSGLGNLCLEHFSVVRYMRFFHRTVVYHPFDGRIPNLDIAADDGAWTNLSSPSNDQTVTEVKLGAGRDAHVGTDPREMCNCASEVDTGVLVYEGGALQIPIAQDWCRSYRCESRNYTGRRHAVDIE